ncbi:MAG: hypothetical protein H7X99_00660 [Saprospiraceae bacterium]|nr:hypothetical protein [Saprospiraceae bacterium]
MQRKWEDHGNIMGASWEDRGSIIGATSRQRRDNPCKWMDNFGSFIWLRQNKRFPNEFGRPLICIPSLMGDQIYLSEFIWTDRFLVVESDINKTKLWGFRFPFY